MRNSLKYLISRPPNFHCLQVFFAIWASISLIKASSIVLDSHNMHRENDKYQYVYHLADVNVELNVIT
jgi:hypothetical protein